MTQPTAPQGTASAQLKQLLQERVNQGVSLAAKAAGQQTGSLAQAVRMTGEDMRQQGQEGQGKIADQIATPLQRWSGTLSQAQPEQLTSTVKDAKPALTQQAQQLKTQAGSQVKKQTQAQVTKAGQGVTALTQGVRQTSQQLRSQGQEVPALVLEAIVEKLEPLSGYLSTADADKLRGDVSVYGQQVKAKVSTAASKAASTLNRTQEKATAKGSQAAKQTATAVRSRPWIPLVGVLAGGLFAARRRSKTAKPQLTSVPPVEPLGTDMPPVEPLGTEIPPVESLETSSLGTSSLGTESFSDGATSVGGVSEMELQGLTRSELQQRAAAAGIATDPNMTISELIAALRTT